MIQVSIGDRWQGFLNDAVETGRYTSVDDIVLEGLRLVQAQEAKLQALRAMVAESLADPTEYTPEEVDAYLDEVTAKLSAGQG